MLGCHSVSYPGVYIKLFLFPLCLLLVIYKLVTSHHLKTYRTEVWHIQRCVQKTLVWHFEIPFQRSLFTSCEVCTVLKQQLNDKTYGVEAKLEILKQYRQHLHSQYSDRTCLWMLQSQSCEPNCEVVYIATDGLDQAKFSLPRHPDLRASAAVYFEVRVTSKMFSPFLGLRYL